MAEKDKPKKRPGRGASKGSSYERKICTMLSMWWSSGARDDIFWRSSGSGARATVRNARGRDTFGMYGDVQAVDPVGQPFLDYFTIEIKRGYNKASIHDLMDCPPTAAQQTMGAFIEQAMKSAQGAGSASWLLITQRDRRLPMAWLPYASYMELRQPMVQVTPCPFCRFTAPIRSSGIVVDVCGMVLDDFFTRISPYKIKCIREPEQL